MYHPDPDGYLFLQRMRAETVADLIVRYNWDVKRTAQRYRIPVKLLKEKIPYCREPKKPLQEKPANYQLLFDF
jgi:hypothetical protein